jgi:hypothetical protein
MNSESSINKLNQEKQKLLAKIEELNKDNNNLKV